MRFIPGFTSINLILGVSNRKSLYHFLKGYHTYKMRDKVLVLRKYKTL